MPVTSCLLCFSFRQEIQIALWHDPSKQKSMSSYWCSSHNFALCIATSSGDFLLTWLRRYLFCGKLLIPSASWVFLHSGHSSLLLRISCLMQDSHSVWVHGSSLGMCSPSSWNSWKQTWHDSRCSRLSGPWAISVSNKIKTLSLIQFWKLVDYPGQWHPTAGSPCHKTKFTHR